MRGRTTSRTRSTGRNALDDNENEYVIIPLNFPLPPRDEVHLYKNFAVPKKKWVFLVQDVLPTALKKIGIQFERNLKQWWHLPEMNLKGRPPRGIVRQRCGATMKTGQPCQLFPSVQISYSGYLRLAFTRLCVRKERRTDGGGSCLRRSQPKQRQLLDINI